MPGHAHRPASQCTRMRTLLVVRVGSIIGSTQQGNGKGQVRQGALCVAYWPDKKRALGMQAKHVCDGQRRPWTSCRSRRRLNRRVVVVLGLGHSSLVAWLATRARSGKAFTQIAAESCFPNLRNLSSSPNLKPLSIHACLSTARAIDCAIATDSQTNALPFPR